MSIHGIYALVACDLESDLLNELQGDEASIVSDVEEEIESADADEIEIEIEGEELEEENSAHRSDIQICSDENGNEEMRKGSDRDNVVVPEKNQPNNRYNNASNNEKRTVVGQKVVLMEPLQCYSLPEDGGQQVRLLSFYFTFVIDTIIILLGLVVIYLLIVVHW
jgi:hypothetical protein